MSNLAQAEHSNEQITALQLRLADRTLLVPNTAVAELAGRLYPLAEPAEGPLLGHIEWRGLSLPLVLFERLAGNPLAQPESKIRLVVLNSLQPIHGQSFYALAIQQIPRTLTVNQQLVHNEQAQLRPYELAAASLEGQDLVIPDLQQLEQWLCSQPTPA